MKPHIISYSGHHGLICRKIDGRKRRATGGHRMQKFDGNMGGITARSAVAHRKQPSLMLINVRYGHGSGQDFFGLCVKKCLDDLGAILRFHSHRFK